MRSSALAAMGMMGLIGAATQALGVDAYRLTVTPASSTVVYSFSASAPFTGGLSGNPAPTAPALPTRLKLGTTGAICIVVNGCSSVATTVNDTIPISGTLAGAGSNTMQTPLRPTGAFTLAVTPASNSAEARDVSLNLVGATPISATANLNNFTYQPFCAAEGTSTTPRCSLFFCGALNLPLGSVSVTSIAVTRVEPAGGTLTPVAGTPGAYDYSIPMTVTAVITSNFQGSAFPTDPQQVPIVLAGRVTITGSGGSSTATATAGTTINVAPPTNSTPAPLVPTPITFPENPVACSNLPVVASLTLTSTTMQSNNAVALSAGGPRIKCPVDADNDGVRTIDDIFVFLNIWFDGSVGSDFDQDGARTIDDIFNFLNVWFASPFPC